MSRNSYRSSSVGRSPWFSPERRRPAIIAGAIAAVIVLCVVIGVWVANATSSDSSSGTQQVQSKYSTPVQEANGTWTILYWVIFQNGVKVQIPNLATYKQIQLGGGYDPTSHGVTSPEVERQQIAARQQSKSVNNVPAGRNPEGQPPVEREAPPVEHEAPPPVEHIAPPVAHEG